MSNYVIYGTPSCGYCVKAKTLLENQGTPYEYHDIQSNTERRAEVRALVPGMKSVPQIFDGDVHIGGYDNLLASLTT